MEMISLYLGRLARKREFIVWTETNDALMLQKSCSSAEKKNNIRRTKFLVIKERKKTYISIRT